MFTISMLILVVIIIIFLEGINFNEYFRNNEKNKGNEAVLSLHDTPTDYLF